MILYKRDFRGEGKFGLSEGTLREVALGKFSDERLNDVSLSDVTLSDVSLSHVTLNHVSLSDVTLNLLSIKHCFRAKSWTLVDFSTIS